MPDTETSTGKKRLRASQACLYCRSKRSKCDGSPTQRPCTQCRDKDLRCEFVRGRRQRRYTDDQATAVREENRALQRALADARRASMSNGSNWDVDSTVRIERDAPESAGVMASFSEIAMNEGSFDEHNLLWDSNLVLGRADRGLSVVQPQEDGSSHYSSDPYRQSPNRAALGSLTSELPCPGPSQSALIHQSARSQSNPIVDATEHFLTKCLSRSAIDYLVGLFFARCMVMLKFIPASQFLSSEESDAPSRQPPSLLLAIIAAALRYATRPDVLAVCFDKDGNNVPAALSKKLLETELLDADINTVHALLAISEVETSRNQFMSGYMYGSMAVRLLFNLRLHYGSGAETALSREEALARYWLLWNLSVQDQTWSIELRCPPSIHPSRLRTARELFESRGQSPQKRVEAESYEARVGRWILNLMVIGREITLELYGAPPQSRPSLVPKLDAKLRTWLKDVPEDIAASPIGYAFSYHFHFGFHMILHSTWLTIHRELAYLDNDTPQLAAQMATSWDVINRSATQIAKLFETFRRTDDARFFHGSGVQWISLAVDGLSRYLDRIPIDQAIEPLAHLQSLQRTLKVISNYFAQAATLHTSTAAKTREVMMKMEGGFDTETLPGVASQVPPAPRPRTGPIAHIYALPTEREVWKPHTQKVSTFSAQTTDVMSNAESQEPAVYPPVWLSRFNEDDMAIGDEEDASAFSGPEILHFGYA